MDVGNNIKNKLVYRERINNAKSLPSQVKNNGVIKTVIFDIPQRFSKTNARLGRNIVGGVRGRGGYYD